jgi:hypothetical protein
VVVVLPGVFWSAGMAHVGGVLVRFKGDLGLDKTAVVIKLTPEVAKRIWERHRPASWLSWDHRFIPYRNIWKQMKHGKSGSQYL